jgi:hypothetical protein
MKLIIVIFLFQCLAFTCEAQKVISGKSKPTKISIQPEYKRGLPPIQYANLNFEDENNNVFFIFSILHLASTQEVRHVTSQVTEGKVTIKYYLSGRFYSRCETSTCISGPDMEGKTICSGWIHMITNDD